MSAGVNGRSVSHPAAIVCRSMASVWPTAPDGARADSQAPASRTGPGGIAGRRGREPEHRKAEASVQGGLTARPAPVTTKRSNMSSVNGAVPTTIIVAGLALAGYALLMTVLNRRMNVPLLAAVGVLEILLLVQVGIIVAKLASGERPAGLATLIGYLIAMPLVPVAAALWGLMERSRWGPAVIAVAGLVAAVLVVRLHQIWPVIHV